MEQSQRLEPTDTLENKNKKALSLTKDEEDCLACDFSCIQGCV
ncbi:hypothetical protein [Candidatus Formimonas warabiya]|nr:hypothetical protein [Candidatus Formimonas warabiya]